MLQDHGEHDGDCASALRDLRNRRQGPLLRADAVDDKREGRRFFTSLGALEQIVDDSGTPVVIDFCCAELLKVGVMGGRGGANDVLVSVVFKYLDDKLAYR